MNHFAWNITFAGDVNLNFINRSFNFVKNLTKDWNSNVYFFWEIESKTSNEILEFFEKTVWKSIFHDISIETEDKIDILDNDEIDWEYSVMSISGVNNSFEEILEGFWEGEEVISIREAEDSKAFWNKIIKVDIIS